MKVLVIGSGGREHALAWKLAQSPQVSEVITVPGNAGVEQVAHRPSEWRDNPDPKALAAWAQDVRVDLTVVGPEAYLAQGMANAFSDRGLKVVGPTKEAALIESSKAFAKQLMAKAGVATADFHICHTTAEARQAVRRMGLPVVVKADGLAAGKGVIIAHTEEEAYRAIDDMMENRLFGEAGRQVVVEQFLVGREASVLAFVDGENVLTMPAAQDHKAVGDGDTGPNTGGMGAYAPAPLVTADLMEEVEKNILLPTVKALNKDGRPYRGILFAGLMLTAEGPYVVEFNCRFGDPETQAILPLLEGDIIPPLLATAAGELPRIQLQWRQKAAVCVVMASRGYPGPYEKGLPIRGLDEAQVMADVMLFHSGTRREDGQWLTDGGRVLGVTALADTLPEARRKAYAAVEVIHFPGAHYRRDIAAKI